MKKKLCLLLSLALCFSVFAAPIAHAQTPDDSVSQDVVMVDVPVLDVNGTEICTVEMSERAVSSIVTGAYIMYCGIKALVFNGINWVLQHPDLTMKMMNLLIDGFTAIQNTLGLLSRADHDGKSYVSAKTVDGNDCYPVGGGIWACRYSL